MSAVLAVLALSAAEEPRQSGLTESIEKRLVQLDVAVEGDPAAIRALTAKDFELYLGEHVVHGLILDRLCGDEGPAPPETPESATPTQPPTRPLATFVFYFDQPHLTMAGHNLSLRTTRDLIQRLIVGGSRASIVSSGERLETVVPMTRDRARLLEGLDRLRDDPFRETYADAEGQRASEVMSSDLESRRSWARGGESPDAGSDIRDTISDQRCLLARTYAREEWQYVRRSTERMRITLDTLSEVPAPKAFVYFADNLRQQAGLHYLEFSSCPRAQVASEELTPSGAVEIDSAINEATARGVHLFTIEAAGLAADSPGWNSVRHRHAQDTLVGLAAETGGEAFLGGASNKRIADRIESLTSCRLLLSFPPGDLPRDKKLNVTLVLIDRNLKVKVFTQGRTVVPSAESIERARLMKAFVDPASSDDGSLRVLLIPRGGDGKAWKASVQLRLRPTGQPDNSAELGASIVRDDTVVDRFASSIATMSASRPMVLEKSLELRPGEFSVVAVARDTKRGDVGSTRVDAEWPNPAKSDAAIAPIAVLQNGPAALAKDGAGSASGALARDVDELLDRSSEISLVSVVCRGVKTREPVIVNRWIDDGSPDEFPTMKIGAHGHACIQIVDVVRPGRLTGSAVDYRIVARVGERLVAQERRTLRVARAR